MQIFRDHEERKREKKKLHFRVKGEVIFFIKKELKL